MMMLTQKELFGCQSGRESFWNRFIGGFELRLGILMLGGREWGDHENL
jgi:hypothetical protein